MATLKQAKHGQVVTFPSVPSLTVDEHHVKLTVNRPDSLQAHLRLRWACEGGLTEKLPGPQWPINTECAREEVLAQSI